MTMDVNTAYQFLSYSGWPDPLFPPVPERQFLSDIFACPLPDHADVFLFLASYNSARYHEALFSEMNIPLPAHLSQAVKKRRAEYLASREVARWALQQFGSDNYLLRNDDRRAPIWPEGLRGSLSHTGQRISLLLTCSDSGKQPGVDCEHLIHPGRAETLHKLIITEAERETLQQSGLPFAAGLTAAFSVKESLYKALFPQLGLFMHFGEAKITQCSPGAKKTILRLNKHFSSAFCEGREFTGSTRSSQSEILSWVVVEL